MFVLNFKYVLVFPDFQNHLGITERRVTDI